MAKKYLTCAETAKLVRAALKEAFPDIKFSVRSSVYSGGASISVKWIDGPCTALVDGVVGVFKGSYFDGSIDYKGSISHMIDGEQVSMGADFIFTTREYSDVSIQRAIDRVMRRYGHDLAAAGIEAPSVDDFRHGRCWNHRFCGHHDLQSEVHAALARHTDRARPAKSKTAGKVVVLGDDGYSRACGSGFSAVHLDEH